MKFSDILIQKRIEYGWKQSDLATKLGTSQVNISRWECGKTLPSLYFQKKLQDLFQLNAHQLGLIEANLEKAYAKKHCQP